MFAQCFGNHLPFEFFDRIGKRRCSGGYKRDRGWCADLCDRSRDLRVRGRGGGAQKFLRELIGRNQCAVFGARDDALKLIAELTNVAGLLTDH